LERTFVGGSKNILCHLGVHGPRGERKIWGLLLSLNLLRYMGFQFFSFSIFSSLFSFSACFNLTVWSIVVGVYGPSWSELKK